MARWLVVACVLLAGCLGGPGAPDGSAAADDEVPAGATATAGPDQPDETPPASQALPSGSAATWFLHAVRDCEGDPCNCGSVRNFMDRADAEGDCDGNGNRPFLEPREGFLLAETWPSEEPLGAWPAGTRLDGRLYLTTDVVSDYELFLRAMTGSLQLAQSEPIAATASDAGVGVTYTEVPFSATFEQPVPEGAKVRLELHLRFATTATSYFIGYEGDHASRFTLTVP